MRSQNTKRNSLGTLEYLNLGNATVRQHTFIPFQLLQGDKAQ